MSAFYVLRDSSGRDYTIRTSARIGREQSCQIRLHEATISPIHATVWIQQDALYVRDENSSNGTFVNGTRITAVQPMPLQAGDQLRVGNTSLVVLSEREAPAMIPESFAPALLSRAPSANFTMILVLFGVASVLAGGLILIAAVILTSSRNAWVASVSKPTVVIQSPANGSQFREGEPIVVQSIASDAIGVTRVDLFVDGAMAGTSVVPAARGTPLFGATQTWNGAVGAHTLGVRAFNAAGTVSDLVTVAITVVPSTAATPPAAFPSAAITSSAAMPTQTMAQGVTSTPNPPTVTQTPTRSASPTPQPTPTPKPTPNFVLAFSDDFSNPNSGLPTTGQSSYYYSQGEYIIEDFSSEANASVLREDPVVSDFALGVDVRIVDGPDTVAMGVNFHAKDNFNCYTFAVDGQGRYSVGKWVDNKWQILVGWTAAPSIKPGKATNHLNVVARGSAITVLANSQPLVTIQDSTFVQGMIGFEALTSAGAAPFKVAFDNLTVTTVSDSSPVTLFKDDFSSAASGWKVWTRVGEAQYQQGEHVIRVIKDDTSVWGRYARPVVSDLQLEIDARFVEAQGDGTLGILFRYKDAANFYRYSMTSDGFYLLDKYYAAEWQSVGGMDWTRSPAILTGSATNHLRVVAYGSQILLYANGQLLAAVQDDSFDKGMIGLVAGRQTGGVVTAAFDNLRLYTPAGAAPIMTPTPVIVTVSPTVTPAIPVGLPPGVYVNSVQVEPVEIHHAQYPTFRVTFINTTSGTLYLKWFIKIYEPNQRNSFGETAKVSSTMPVGSTEIASAANWKASGATPCRPFIARVFYQAQDNSIQEFPKPGGDNFWFYFSVCP